MKNLILLSLALLLSISATAQDFTAKVDTTSGDVVVTATDFGGLAFKAEAYARTAFVNVAPVKVGVVNKSLAKGQSWYYPYALRPDIDFIIITSSNGKSVKLELPNRSPLITESE